jgi:hypothetical protein
MSPRGGIEAATHVVGAGAGEHSMCRAALGGKRQQRLDLRHRNALCGLRVGRHGEQCTEQDCGERVSRRRDGRDGSDERHGPK